METDLHKGLCLKGLSTAVAKDGLGVRVLALNVLADIREGVTVEVAHSALVVFLTLVPGRSHDRINCTWTIC